MSLSCRGQTDQPDVRAYEREKAGKEVDEQECLTELHSGHHLSFHLEHSDLIRHGKHIWDISR